MRDFFKELLDNLYTLTGSRQMEFIDPNQLTLLLDELEKACRKYSYIPQEVQQSEIKKQIIEDQEFNSLNPKMIHKWFQKIASKYWHEEAHMNKDQVYDAKPCEPEVAEKYIKEWKEALAKVGNIETSHQTIRERYPDYFRKPKYLIEGIEIEAESLDEARQIYLEKHLDNGEIKE